MATPQPLKRPTEQRKPSGNNILSRMLQMEKQGKQQRTSSASPTFPLSPRAEFAGVPSAGAPPSPMRSPRSPIQMPQSPSRPLPMPRSQTSPALSSYASRTEKPSEKPKPFIEPLKLDISKDDDTSAAEEICLSPSWSDHGEKKRKKEKKKAEKDQKERDKKSRQDEEKQRTSDVRSGKRLSKKPPPAAMETQKMPSALRRNSWMSIISSHSVSGENTARSSQEEKRPSRLSISSLRSNQRSHSTPPCNTEESSEAANSQEKWAPIVSPSAPKLPSFRWSSRRSPPDTGKSDTLASDDAYERDLVTFAYRLEASTFMSDPGKVEGPRSKQSSTIGTPQQQPSTPILSRSSTDPNLVGIAQHFNSSHSPPQSPSKKLDISRGELVDKQENSLAEQQASRLGLKDSAKGATKTILDYNHNFGRNPPSPRSAPLPQVRSSHDGSSYVHKQRMYHQQLSIAGFEEQQAVKDANDLANELAAEYEALLAVGPSRVVTERGRTSSPSRVDGSSITQPSTVKKVRIDESSVSPASSRQRHRSSSPRTESTSNKHTSRGPTPLSQETTRMVQTEKANEEAKLRASLQAARETSLSKPQASTGFKKDKILGFRRRTKEPPAFISVPYNTENQVIAVQSAPLEGPKSDEPMVKRSKMERLFKDPRPSFAEPDSSRSSSSLARNQLDENVAQDKTSKTHSRTRTSSSTVLNDTLSSPGPLAKSKTEPLLNPTSKSEKSKTIIKDPLQSLEVRHPEVQSNAEVKDENLRKKPEDLAEDPNRGSQPVSNVKPSPATGNVAELAKTSVVEVKPTKKSPAEVIVQSETGDGLVRKASLTRPRSNPQLQTQTTATKSLPSLDFLPQLKHQPLVKRERQSPTRPAPANSTSVALPQSPTHVAPLSSHSPTPANPPDLKLIPRSPRRPPSQFPLPAGSRHNRSATDVGTLSSFGKGALAEGLDAKPVAKLFVICCKCKFWHDLPSKLYEAMALPKELHKADGKLTGARLETAVRCPWCEHAMTTFCCQGWTTVVYLHERHH